MKKIFAHIDWEMEGIEVDSSYQILTTLGSGVSACMTCTGYSGPFTELSDLIFKNGIVRVVSCSNNIDKEGVWIGNNEHDFEKVHVTGENSFLMQLKDFVRYLGGEIESPIDGKYGRDIVRQVELSYKSHTINQAVEDI